MADESNSTISEATMSKLAESMNQFAASALTNLVVPEFRGSPGEDVREFLSRFKSATVILNDEMRCLAIQKALVGSAKIWAKDNLKSQLGNWKRIKDALIQRFEGSDVEVKHLEKLSKMQFDPKLDTLISYVEEYAARYRQAHPGSNDAEIIRSLKVNLPKDVQRSFNILNDNWSKLEDIKMLYSLAKLAEDKILSYEAKDESANIKTVDLVKVLKEVKDMLKPREEEKTEPTKALAAIRENQAERREPYHPYRYPKNSPRERYTGNQLRRPHKRDDRYTKRYNQNYYRAGEAPRDSGGPRLLYQPPLAIDNDRPRADNPSSTSQHQAAAKDKAEAYYIKYGKPPGLCQHCRGDHFNRHCPFLNLN